MTITPPLPFPVTIRLPVLWHQLDAFGHVNNAVYFQYFEAARIAYFVRVGFGDLRHHQGIGPILARTQAVFKAALFYPDEVQVSARVSSLELDRMTMQYEVFSTAQNRVAAEGDARVVAYDYSTRTKTAVPREVAQAVEALEVHIGS